MLLYIKGQYLCFTHVVWFCTTFRTSLLFLVRVMRPSSPFPAFHSVIISFNHLPSCTFKLYSVTRMRSWCLFPYICVLVSHGVVCSKRLSEGGRGLRSVRGRYIQVISIQSQSDKLIFQPGHLRRRRRSRGQMEE